MATTREVDNKTQAHTEKIAQVTTIESDDSTYESGQGSPEHQDATISRRGHLENTASHSEHDASFTDYRANSQKETVYRKSTLAKTRGESQVHFPAHRTTSSGRGATSQIHLQPQDHSTTTCTDDDLLGDHSRPCSLPTVPGRMHDIPSIAPSTLTQILTDCSHDVTILDCRYPYEYQGGHIIGAKNLYSNHLVEEEFLSGKQPLASVVSSSKILVFHCEFSIERGPAMARFLRGEDRALNIASYPALHYPEIYLLDGGYKAFWEFCNHSNVQQLCEPRNYRPMIEEGFKEEMWKYRKSGKSRKPTKPRMHLMQASAGPARKRALF